MAVDDSVSLQHPSAPASLSSDMHPHSNSEHILAILLGAALALVLVGVCLCFARRFLRLRDQRQQLQQLQQQQQRVSRSPSLSLSMSSSSSHSHPPPLAPMTELLHHPLQQHHQHHQQQQHQLSSTSLFSTTVASGVNSIRPFSSPSSPHPPSSAITSTAAAASTTTVPMASISIPMDLPLSNLSTLHPSAGSPSSSSSIPWMTSATSTQHNSNNNNSNTSLSESPSSSGFSLVRFFSRRASQKAPAQRQSSLRAIYLHPQRAKPAEDRTLQKRPISTTSSSDGYYWSEGGPSTMKERSADGFPIITLTSPTNSESSIPRHEDYAPSFSGQQDNTDSPYASATAAAAASTSSGSRPLWRAGAMESLDSSTPSRRRSSEKSLMPESPEYQPPNPLIPSHMFLHPLTTYTRPIASPPQTKASPTPPSSSSRSDFPPTYEEALDAGASSSCGRPPGEHS
ncbi:hypothetical protein EMPS_03434 [Entomortierella parvispora]|uniref:Uncharacterized protein n=1 Tax=Entomortierella parvispora TaxID=205924 RepID=A0A9P3H6J6_9FUNG|nr:hypothetical protein EMPS_03434 [Entomortierella parvispora]